MIRWLLTFLGVIGGRKGAKPHFYLGRTPPPENGKKRPSKPRSLGDLAARLQSTPGALLAFRPEYTEFTKAKRRGGTRTLYAPNSKTKHLQKAILRRVIGPSHVHPYAYAYERGKGIKAHATLHANRAVIVGMDIVSFFPQTQAKWIREYFLATGWDNQAAKVLTNLTTHEGGLPQGAPTSPKLSNLVNHLLDKRLEGLARSFGARYSRYADDITFSFGVDDNRLVKNLVNLATQVIYECGYIPHEKEKLFIRRAHQQQLVTGLVVNDGPPRISRETKRWLRAAEHRMKTGKQATLSPAQLAGWKAYIQMIEGPPRR